jgi:hypothetical protein
MKSTIVATCVALVAGVVIGRATIASPANMASSGFETVGVSSASTGASVSRSFAAAADASSDLGYGTSGITDWTRNFFWQ